jgi:hypothetical protein
VSYIFVPSPTRGFIGYWLSIYLLMAINNFRLTVIFSEMVSLFLTFYLHTSFKALFLKFYAFFTSHYFLASCHLFIKLISSSQFLHVCATPKPCTPLVSGFSSSTVVSAQHIKLCRIRSVQCRTCDGEDIIGMSSTTSFRPSMAAS